MWRPISDPDFPWTGMLFGGTIVGIWYWCTDQYIVQRTLAANNIKIGRRGAIFAAYLKILPIFIFLIPGVIAFALHKQGVIQLERSDEAFPLLVKTLLPVGVKGLVAGGLMAALMSSLASVFNSCSTIFTMDIYKIISPKSTERKLLNVGKIATAIMVIMGIIWIPIMDLIGGGVLYQYLQSVQSYIAPPVAAIFLSGLLVATLRICSEIFKDSLSGIMYQFATINFSHMAIFMFLFSISICIVTSFLTTPKSEISLQGLTFSTITDEQKKSAKNSYTKGDVFFSVLLIAIVIMILTYFTG
jgi:SSS family solute:Na+ symporter